jgi:hypothetical protein
MEYIVLRWQGFATMNGKGRVILSLVGSVTLGLSLLVGIAILVLAVPEIAASSPARDMPSLNMSPLSPDSLISAAELKECATYYWRRNLLNVGQDGNQRVADTTPPLADVPEEISVKLNADLEIVRFYSNPSLSDTWQISEDITGLLWVNTSLPDASLNIKLFDYNPTNGAKTLLDELPLTLLSAGEQNVEFNFTPPAAPISAEHRLLFVLEGKKGTPPPQVGLQYDSVTRASRFTICRLIPGGPPPIATIYLPLIITSKVGPMTILYVESVNTGGINPVRILDLNTNQELLNCSIDNNITQLCGTFPTPSNGQYKITARTNQCGLLQGTFGDATPGGTVQRRVFCN